MRQTMVPVAASMQGRRWAAGEIAELLAAYRYRSTTEAELVAGIAQVLSEAGAQFEREVDLGRGDRVDFLVGSVALEVKIAGSRTGVLRQLHRYAAHKTITSLVLVSTRRSHGLLPGVLLGKHVHVVVLGGAF